MGRYSGSAADGRSRLPMKVAVPFVEFRPELRRDLEADGIEPVFLKTTGWDGYWVALNQLWDEGEPFIILEQDKFPKPGALHALWDCDQPWCTYPVRMRNGNPQPYPTLACMKFGQPLLDGDRDLMTKVGTVDVGYGPREWSRLDMVVAAFCSNLAQCHWHETGRVEHRHVR